MGDARPVVERDGVYDRRRRRRVAPPWSDALGAGPRPADPPPGVTVAAARHAWRAGAFSDASDSCPRGLKYVNNPWQDRVIDAFRRSTPAGATTENRQGAGDNNGVPVTAAGDEAAYHYSGGPDQGSPDVHLVDMLIGHAASARR